MNHLLASLQPYPFERLKELFAFVTPNPAYSHISLGIGEPRHATPQVVLDALAGATNELASYPPTAGSPGLHRACAGWVQRRYGVHVQVVRTIPVHARAIRIGRIEGAVPGFKKAMVKLRPGESIQFS